MKVGHVGQKQVVAINFKIYMKYEKVENSVLLELWGTIFPLTITIPGLYDLHAH